MGAHGGFITLHRQITNWEWYKDVNTKVLFLHLLLIANWETSKIMRKTIRRGQVITSLPALATGTGLSIRQTRTALAHLISTGEVTDKANNQYRIITIVKYDDYQNSTGNLTGNRQANDRQLDRQSTDESTPSNKYNKNNKKNKNNNTPPNGGGDVRAKRFTPPTTDDVRAFCQENGLQVDAERFVNYYTSNGWRAGRNPMKDWKASVRYWAKSDQQNGAGKPAAAVPAQDYDQRDYSGETDAAFERMMERIRQRGGGAG